MRITILHRYFWPQSYPYARMLKDIAESLVNAGHDVKVMTSRQGTEQEDNQRLIWMKHNGIKMSFITLGSEKKKELIRKALNAIYFGMWVFYKLLFGRQDVVMVATTPPIVVAALVRWVGFLRGFKYVYHCQDIHPEAMLINREINENIFYRILRKIDKKNIDAAWKVITLSGDMRNTLAKRTSSVEHIHLINNYIFESAPPKDNKEIKVSDTVKFLFAGSLGRLQNLELLFESLEPFAKRKDVIFEFMGEGVLRSRLEAIKQRLNLDNVSFLGQKTFAEAVMAMREADAGIVSLAPGICNVAYPSKSVMYLGNGLPIFALVDEQTELAHFIEAHTLGVSVTPDSTSVVSEAIEKMIGLCKKEAISRKKVEALANEFFGKEQALKKFEGIFAND